MGKKKNEKNLPSKSGWCWVLIDGYDDPTPCWFSLDKDDPDYSYFLPGGMGDGSSNGVYLDDIEKIGPEIIVPIF